MERSSDRTVERVFLVTPLRGTPPSVFPSAAKPDPKVNIEFARKCMTECLARGQAPFAPHLLYPQALNDDEPKDRELGMVAGRAWLAAAEAVECYVDRGVSSGMRGDLEAALSLLLPIRFRTLAGAPPSEAWLHAERVPHPVCGLCAMGRPTEGTQQERIAEASRLPGDPSALHPLQASTSPYAEISLESHAAIPLDVDPDETLDPGRPPRGPIADPEEAHNDEPAV
jgi:hypothetical protein